MYINIIYIYIGCPKKNDPSLNACHSVNFLGTIEIFHMITVERLYNKRCDFHNPPAIRSLFFEASILTLKYVLFKWIFCMIFSYIGSNIIAHSFRLHDANDFKFSPEHNIDKKNIL